MKILQKLLAILSILAIGNHFYADTPNPSFIPDLYRYYGNPTSPNSYIDTNNTISMESYIIANPYPNNYPNGSEAQYGMPNNLNQKYFQPADGSMTTGTYDVINKTATTALHNYKNIIIVDGTVKTPQLNPQAKYVDAQGKEYQLIGSLNQPSQDASDMFVYYFFGQIADTQPENIAAKKAANVPIQTFDSANE